MKRKTTSVVARVQTRAIGAGLAATAVGALTAAGGQVLTGAELVAAGVVVTAGAGYLRLRPGRVGGSNEVIGRWQQRADRHGGTASRWDITRTSSRWAMRRKATVVCPSLRRLSWWRQLTVPARTFATPLCRAGRQTVWTSVEESTLRVGIPGTGKTAEMICRVLDAPGGVVATSTAADLYESTAQLRAERGPVAVFNPSGIGAIASTLRWSPLTGCADPGTATRRAADLMGPPTRSAEGERWDAQARRVLALLLHAAALGGYRVSDIHAWIATPDIARDTVLAALARSPQRAQMMQAAAQALGLNPRTRDGVMLAIAPALAWVTHPGAATCGDTRGDDQFVTADLVDLSGALYLMCDNDGTVAPLVGALVAEIVYQARRSASARPGGRLDPALTLVLDEVALTCPVPVDQWLPEVRKFSITIHAACQGLGQLRGRWGDHAAATILNCAAAVLIFGGCKDPTDLRLFGDLAGSRDEYTHVLDGNGRVTSTSKRRVPVIEPAMLAGLPNHHALLVRRGMPVALVRTPIGWKRRDVRRAHRRPMPVPVVDVDDRDPLPMPVPA